MKGKKRKKNGNCRHRYKKKLIVQQPQLRWSSFKKRDCKRIANKKHDRINYPECKIKKRKRKTFYNWKVTTNFFFKKKNQNLHDCNDLINFILNKLNKILTILIRFF